jgi:hypothetical protein
MHNRFPSRGRSQRSFRNFFETVLREVHHVQADFVAHSCAQLGNGQSGFRAGRQPVTSSVGAERFEHTCADSGRGRQGANQEGVRTASKWKSNATPRNWLS